MKRRKYPIGIQDFAGLRTEGFVYVDKTPLIRRLVQEGRSYFLSRPRRFGKSLLLSTLKAYFEGKRELFGEIAGEPALAMADLEREWLQYPVFHLDFNVGDYHEPDGLKSSLHSNLAWLEETWGKNQDETGFPARFRGLIRRAAEKTGRKVVV
ncbi:MAG: AAA family ATPase, partial [Spirochaetaceae bacterium]|nr:AAA family ATPase [Spirochaetaceae bacterium]